MKILKRLLPYARPLYHFIPEYFIYTLFGVMFGLLNFALLIPVLDILFNGDQVVSTASQTQPVFSPSFSYVKELFNYYFNATIAEKGKFNALIFVCLLIGFSILISNIFKYLAVKTLIRLRLKMMKGVRNELFGKYMMQSLTYHHNYTKGEGLMVITTEVQEIEGSIINSLQVVLRDPIVVFGYFLVLMSWSAQLTLFTLFFLPVTGIIISSITKRLKKLNYFSQEMTAKMMNFTNECLDGIKQVQSFTSGKLMEKRFDEINDAFSKNSKKLFSKKELASPISEVLGVLAVLILIIYAGYLILNGKSDLTGTQFIAYIALYTQIIQPLKNLSQTSSTLQKGIIACEKIFSVLDTPILIHDRLDAKNNINFSKKISINDISFSYSEKPVIENFSLTIAKGKKIALVGESGSGKSTLIDLICRFYDVKSGSIEVDGVNIKDIKIDTLRKQIAIVSQNSFLFNDTIYNNILLGNLNATKEEVISAAKIANAHNFITQSEDGYETIVGEGGVKLSGGQKQRITIARAILKNAPILILDEATSSLDTESERLVQDAINNMMKDKTSLIIAHRLSTVFHADEILVLQKGRIIERGNHTELIDKNGIYKKLVQMQEFK